MKNKDINNQELISEMQTMLRKPKLTMESMIFSDVNEDDFEDSENMNDMPSDEDNVELPEENPIDVTDTINKIRQMSLQAIAKLADNPASEQYQLLKKVWNLVDKAFETDKKNINGED